MYCLIDCSSGMVWYSKSKTVLERKAVKLGLDDYIIFEEGTN